MTRCFTEADSAPDPKSPPAGIGPAARHAPGSQGANASARYLVTTAVLVLVGLIALIQCNRSFAPEMYDRDALVSIADALASDRNYAVFDLNINLRDLRDHHIERLANTPDVAVLGASHWQEAHAGLVAHKRLYNAHVHRDYYEDMLAVTELFVRHDRLPRQMIIAIRDNLFTPVSERRDHLWLPGIPYYRAMAKRLGIQAHSEWEVLPVQRWRELLSLPMLHTNAARWYHAAIRPHATVEREFADLDLLVPDGSILWSGKHRNVFSAERAERLAADYAESRANDPPRIDPKGVVAMDALLRFLRSRNVEIFLAHPPFNPAFYERIKNTPYMDGLSAIERLTRELALAHDARIIGSFDPTPLGCDRSMYIDAEHANADCLGRLFQQYVTFDRSAPVSTRPAPDAPIGLASEPTVALAPSVPVSTRPAPDAEIALAPEPTAGAFERPAPVSTQPAPEAPIVQAPDSTTVALAPSVPVAPGHDEDAEPSEIAGARASAVAGHGGDMPAGLPVSPGGIVTQHRGAAQVWCVTSLGAAPCKKRPPARAGRRHRIQSSDLAAKAPAKASNTWQRVSGR